MTNPSKTYDEIADREHVEGFTQERIDWRRNKVMELLAHGYTSQAEIARIMQVPHSTIHKDVEYLRNRAKENVAKFTDTFAFEFDKCLYEANMIQKEAWRLATESKYERNRILSLQLCKDILMYKTDLISNADVVLKASNFIELKKKKVEAMIEQEGGGDMVEFASGPRRMLPQNVIHVDTDSSTNGINASCEDISDTSTTDEIEGKQEQQ